MYLHALEGQPEAKSNLVSQVLEEESGGTKIITQGILLQVPTLISHWSGVSLRDSLMREEVLYVVFILLCPI